MRFTCPVCAALNEVPELVYAFYFPTDLKETMDLLEGRLNCVTCPACKEQTAMLTLVMVLDVDGKAALLTGPKDVSWGPEELAKVTEAGYKLEKSADYDELRVKVIKRLDRYLKPAVEAILSPKQLERSECIKRMSPLVLRVFKSRIDGFLPPVLQFSGEPSPELAAKIERESYVAMVSDHLQRILEEAAARSKVTMLLEEVEKLVPIECLTAEVLEAIQAKCRTYVRPDEDFLAFSGGFSQEVLNAVAHSCAGRANPRGKEMAMSLISAWIFSRRPNVQMDPQFLLSPDLVKRILRFEDLWDVWMGGVKKLTKERFQGVSQMMEQYGFSHRLLETLKGNVIEIARQKDGKAIDKDGKPIDVSRYEKLLLEQMPFNRSYDMSGGFGVLLEGSMRPLLYNGQQETALNLADRLVARAREAGDEIATVSLAAHAADVLNYFQLYDAAAEMIGQVIELRHSEHLGLDRFIYVFTVAGNTLRYIFHFQEALVAYDLALKAVDAVPDKARQEEDRKVLEKNIGIIYRDTGRYSKALPLLQKAAQQNPRDHNHQFGLAIFYYRINRYQEALRYLDRAIELAHGGINASVSGNYLLGRGLLRRSLGDTDAGLEDLKVALEILPTEGMRMRAAAAALGFQPTTQKGKEFLEQCRDMAMKHLQQDGDEDAGLQVVVVSELAEYQLRTGKPDEAKALLERFWEDQEQGLREGPWQLEFTMGRTCHARGEDARAWEHLSRAWRSLEEDVPRADDAEFSTSWMRDKDEVQSTLMSIGCDLAQRGKLSPEVLPALYDFSNGREISARMLKEAGSGWSPPEQLLARYCAARLASERKLDAFFLLESEETVFLGHVGSKDSKVAIIGDLATKPKRLTAIRNSFRAAVRAANPADLGDLEASIEGWEAVETRISSLVRAHAAADADVLFLPGRALTGLPLHLIRKCEGRLSGPVRNRAISAGIGRSQ